MKRLFSHIILLIIGTILILSCNDDTFVTKGDFDGKIGLKLALSLPGEGGSNTRAGGTDATTGNETGSGYENLIERTDIRLLIFQEDKFEEEITGLRITGSGTTYFLEGVTEKEYENTIEPVVLANLKSRGVAPAAEEFIGLTLKEVYQKLEYSYGENSWIVDAKHRIPMWGSTTLSVNKGQQNSGNIDMHRAIAKIGFTVNDGKGLPEIFTLKSIRIYFSNTKGYCAPMPENIPQLGSKIIVPSIPSSSGTISAPFLYEVEDGAYTYEDKIYLPESDNKNANENKKAACMVVGGNYSGDGLVGSDKECYYRIDFKDDLESGNSDELLTYDILRNHSYRFNIRSVSTPGTPTPEEALDNLVVGMQVDIEAWENVPMRGIPDQYTLTTTKSAVTFNNQTAEDEIKVTTDYGQDNEATENGSWEIVEIKQSTTETQSTAPWFTVEKGTDNRTIYIRAIENYGIYREGSFYIQTGNLKKQIIVRQEQPATANSYVVGDGVHELIVTIKGNGNKGLAAEGVQLDDNASIKPARIGIIWETKVGLVKLIDAQTSAEISGGNYANYDKGKGTIQYKVETGGATIGEVSGGNALIGAFDEKNNILWSWHIWACPNMIDANGITEACIQDWTLNGYKVLDRNLGALSNSPGVASLGLLYQWGRKDPFIGAGQTNDIYTNETGRLYTENYLDKEWKVTTTTSNTTIPYTIANPTVLTYDGLSAKETTKGGYLWGTNGGLNDKGIKDLGSKTIYDPCPAGYRVPPVDAFVFVKREKETVLVIDKEGPVQTITLGKNETKELTEAVKVAKDNGDYTFYPNGTTLKGSRNGTKYKYIIVEYHSEEKWKVLESSETSNWNKNLLYIPHKADVWYEKYGGYYSGDYVLNAKHYGFYLNYKELKEPDLASGSKTDNVTHYDLKDYNNLTWLPISGAYDPYVNSNLSFKDVTITQGSSLSVNSFLWTNSSVKGIDGVTRPAAMFLHGTENKINGEVGYKINGRHIHALLGTSPSDDIIAQPQQAGAVRCVRDVKKDFSESNRAPDNVVLNKNIGGTSVSETLISIDDTWTIVDGGAPWFKIYPDHGTPDKGAGQDITFTVLQTNDTGSERTATVFIKFNGESKPRPFKVTQSAR